MGHRWPADPAAFHTDGAARDPYFSFKFKGGKVGDKIVVSWTDTEGDTRTDETLVT